MKKLFVFIAVFLVCAGVFAADYVIEKLDVSVSVGRDAVNSVREDYVFNYYGPHHGFYRYIPREYRGEVNRNVRVMNVRCSDDFSVSYEDGSYVMQIGSSRRTWTGLKDYTITYDYDIGADTNKGYDEFYMNLVGDGWEIPINSMSFSVRIPCTLDQAQLINVTRGAYGSEQKVDYTVSDGGSYIVVSGSANGLSAGNAVTIRVQLPDGWYQGARTSWDLTGIFRVVNPVLCVILLALGVLCWFTFGRDKTPIITARYEPPRGFSPLTVGYIADGQVDDKDVTSMLYYWADKGLMTISEERRDEFSFTKLSDISQQAPEYEKKLFDGFFRRTDSSGNVTIKTLSKGNFFQTISETKAGVSKYFSGDKALTDKKSRLFSALFGVLAFIPLLAFSLTQFLSEYMVQNILFSLVPSFFLVTINAAVFKAFFKRRYVRRGGVFRFVLSFVPSFIGFIVLAVFSDVSGGGSVQLAVSVISSCLLSLLSAIMERRSEYGHTVLEEVLGYREFIDKVSMDELKLMIDRDPQYYYHVLSYAIVLGLEDKWARKFKDIAVPPPVWYRGVTPFDIYMYASMSHRLNSALAANAFKGAGAGGAGTVRFGGGGFGSGGFAGGGFGGGGGRAW